MDDTAAEPAALMVLACWTEGGGRMVVRITRTHDVATTPAKTSYASTRPEVLEEVERWLDSVVTER